MNQTQAPPLIEVALPLPALSKGEHVLNVHRCLLDGPQLALEIG